MEYFRLDVYIDELIASINWAVRKGINSCHPLHGEGPYIVSQSDARGCPSFKDLDLQWLCVTDGYQSRSSDVSIMICYLTSCQHR